MNRFDDFIHDSISQEDIPMPKNYHQNIQETLHSLPEKTRRPQMRLVSRLTAAAASFVLVFLMVLPNASPAYAHALEDVPVLGALVEIFTIRSDSYTDDRHDLDVTTPNISISDDMQAAEELNAEVEALTNAIIEKFYQDLDPQNREAIYVDYEVVTNTPDWFTLKLTVEQINASGNIRLYFYHIDRASNRYVTLGDLFDVKGLTAIEAELRAQMAKNSSFSPNEAELLTDDQSFYFNADGDLVIVYNEAEIAPASMGNPEFTIPAAIIQPYRK